MSLSELYTSGGTIWMHPITVLFSINMGIIIFVVFKLVQKKTVHHYWIESIKQLGGLALAFGALSTLVGFFQMFGALEEMKETLPIQVIMGGTKVAIITVMYGLLVFCISLTVYIIIKLMNRTSAA
jgi:uncharacterized membrane protein